MSKFFKILILLIGFFFLITACTKYQDDPTISIESTTQRLTKKNWQVKNIIINGIDSTSNFTFALTQTTTPLPILSTNTGKDFQIFSVNDTRDIGDFTLDDDNKQISFHSTNYSFHLPLSIYPNKDFLFPSTTTCTILELDKSIFKISTTINGIYYEYTFTNTTK